MHTFVPEEVGRTWNMEYFYENETCKGDSCFIFIMRYSCCLNENLDSAPLANRGARCQGRGPCMWILRPQRECAHTECDC